MEHRKGFRFPIFWKILGSSLALAGLLIALSYVYALYRQSQLEGRGRYLEAYLKRYMSYQEGLGQAVLSVADILAEDATLRLALSQNPQQRTGKAMPSVAADVPTDPEAARTRADLRAREMFQSLTAKNALHPAIFVVFDKDGRAIFVPDDSPVKADELRELEAWPGSAREIASRTSSSFTPATSTRPPACPSRSGAAPTRRAVSSWPCRSSATSTPSSFSPTTSRRTSSA